MSSINYAAVAPHQEVKRRFLHLKPSAKAAIVDSGWHTHAGFADKRPDLINIIIHTPIDCDNLHAIAECLEDLLEPRHLRTAGDAIGRPQFEVDWLLAINILEVDSAAIDGLQRQHRSRRADQARKTRIFCDVGGIVNRRRFRFLCGRIARCNGDERQ
jgi:hypothetical protein